MKVPAATHGQCSTTLLFTPGLKLSSLIYISHRDRKTDFSIWGQGALSSNDTEVSSYTHEWASVQQQCKCSCRAIKLIVRMPTTNPNNDALAAAHYIYVTTPTFLSGFIHLNHFFSLISLSRIVDFRAQRQSSLRTSVVLQGHSNQLWLKISETTWAVL